MVAAVPTVVALPTILPLSLKLPRTERASSALVVPIPTLLFVVIPVGPDFQIELEAGTLYNPEASPENVEAVRMPVVS